MGHTFPADVTSYLDVTGIGCTGLHHAHDDPYLKDFQTGGTHN